MLALEDIHKGYGETLALRGLSLRAEPGEVLGILGPNGAGKSTTIGIASGLRSPDSGAASINGKNPREHAARRDLGVAPQEMALYPDLTGREHLRLFAELYGISPADREKAINNALEQVGLEPRARHRVYAYSGGMKRRLALAGAVLHSPNVVLLDEPTAGVDAQAREAILDIARRTAARGAAVVYCTHYMEEAQSICDRVAILDHGELVAIGTVDQLLTEHAGQAIVTIERTNSTIRTESADPAAYLANELSRESDAQITNIAIEQPSLESVFFSLTGRSLRD
ncbi:MAG: ABC transporter ATP-binding protein [Planctomycetota bacterium]